MSLQISAKMAKYTFIEGYKFGNLLYLEEEKHLFVRKSGDNGEQIFICYQSILAKSNKKKEAAQPNCTARVKLTANGICTRNKIGHTNHENHEIHFHDLEILNAVKENCRTLQNIIPITAHKVSVKEVFLQEIAK